MDHKIFLNKQVLQKEDLTTNRENIHEKRDNHNLLGWVKGQNVQGMITSVTDGIKIRIRGQELAVPEGMFPELSLGDFVLFEVQNVTNSQIELSAVNQSSTPEGKPAEATVRLNAVREVLLSRKEQEGRQTEREEAHKDRMKQIEGILSRITEKDYRMLEEEGFSVEDFTVTGLEAAISRLHTTSREGLEDSGPDHRRSKSFATAKEIEQRLKEANLPAEAETVRKVRTALNISASIGALDEASMKWLIGSELPPTLENLYKAKYSNTTLSKEKGMTEETWSQLQPQVEEVIRIAGFEVNEENLSGARWLVEEGLALTKDNFIYYNQLSAWEEFTDQSEALDQILQEMGGGTDPKEVILLPGLKSRVRQLAEKLDTVGEQEIREAVRTEEEINIKLLTDKKYREEYLKEEHSRELTEKQQLEAIKAQRLLEELRLKMTLKAAGALERKGIHVETQSLEKVVEELKLLEESYYRRLFTEADIEPDADQVRLLQETSRELEQLKQVPSYTLGVTLSSRKLMTVPGLAAEGRKLAEQLNKAKEAYETLMTEPNREYGDSIQKAFRNATGVLLSELGLEDTLYNRRAVRILGYNRMEISQENLEFVKAYDLEVNTLLQRLHPAVTVRLIKDGINPMGVPISELNKEIDRLRQEQGISAEERFSTFLRRLEREDQIQEEERQAYIGIYRLLHKIEKSDGAALGAVLKSGREVTLSNLLTAVRSMQKGAVDTIVDDGFGMLQGLSDREATITDQINGVFGGADSGSNPDSGKKSPEGMEARTEFFHQALKQLYSETTPEGLLQMQQRLEQTDQSSSQASGESSPMLSSGKGIWEKLKEVSAEKLFDMLSLPREEEEVYTGKLQELKQLYQNSEHAVRFLEDYHVPCTGTNILLAEQILSNSGTFFKKYLQLKNENNPENEKIKLQKMLDPADTLIDRNSAQRTYEQLEEELKELLEKERSSDRIDALRLTELKNMGAQMTLMDTLAKKEFYQIPIETGKGIASMNLTIVRGSGNSGKVTVSLTTEALGRVKADMSLKDRMLNGYIVSDSRVGAELLQSKLQDIREVLKEEEIVVKQLEVCYDRQRKDSYSYQYSETEAADARKAEEERLLYRIARSMVLFLSEADASAQQQTAVS